MAINPWGWGLGGIGYGIYGGNSSGGPQPPAAKTPLQQYIVKGGEADSGLGEATEPRDLTENEFTHYGMGFGSLEVPSSGVPDINVTSKAYNPYSTVASLVGLLGPLGTSSALGTIAEKATPGSTKPFGAPTTHLTGRSVPDTVNLAQQPKWGGPGPKGPGFKSFWEGGPKISQQAEPQLGMVASALAGIDAALGLGASGQGRTAAELARDMAVSGRPDAHGPGGIGRSDFGNLR